MSRRIILTNVLFKLRRVCHFCCSWRNFKPSGTPDNTSSQKFFNLWRYIYCIIRPLLFRNIKTNGRWAEIYFPHN
nr:MAG TPA: hypothetical protein [Caudoviricetes sp.]